MTISVTGVVMIRESACSGSIPSVKCSYSNLRYDELNYCTSLTK